METTVTLQEAESRLAQLIEELEPGKEVLILRDAVPVGKLVRLSRESPQPVPGRGRGKLIITAEDKEHLKDLAEYMP